MTMITEPNLYIKIPVRSVTLDVLFKITSDYIPLQGCVRI